MRIQPLGLLVQGGVDRRIAGAQAYDLKPRGVGIDDAGGDLVEVEVLRVDELRTVGAVVEHGVVDVGAGVDAHVGGVEQRHGAQGQEVGRTGPGADEVHVMPAPPTSSRSTA